MSAALPERADVVVIGAGVAGLCTARFLAEAGTDVVVVEAEAPGGGASGRGSGHALVGVVEHPYRVVEALGRSGARPLYALSSDSAALLDGWGLRPDPGGWWVALDHREPDQLRQSADALGHLGIEATVRDAADVGAHLGIAKAGPALFVPSEGAVQPGPALRALADAVTGAGGRIVPHTRVTRVSDAADGVRVHTAQGAIAAEVVVYAAGAGVLGLDPYFDDKVLPVRDQALRTAPWSSPLPPAARAGFAYTWWRPDGDALVIGGCRWALPHLGVGDREAVVDSRVQKSIEAFLRRLTPDVAVVERWAWIEAHTCDGLPIVGPFPGSVRHVACVGFVGNDWGLAPAAARSVAHGLVGDGDAHVTPQFAATRFQ